jgi:hypothetical protein
MKALTLWQPWATLVAIGAKSIETRSWSTRHRGPLAIHAAKRFPPGAQSLAMEREFRTVLLEAGYGDPETLPRGAVVAVAQLVDVRTTDEVRGVLQATPRETIYGDFSRGRWAWVLRDVVRLPQPIQAYGGRGLWTWPVPVDAARFLEEANSSYVIGRLEVPS